MKNIEAWQGDTILLSVTRPDEGAENVTLLVGKVGEPAIFTKEAEYSTEGKADLTITDEENVQATIPFGEYNYMLRVAYSDGTEITFPKPGECSDDELPKFIIKQRIGDA